MTSESLENFDGWKEEANIRMTKMISEELVDEAPMVRDWILVVTYVDDEGYDCTAFNAHPESRRTATLGMLTHALEVERASIFWENRNDG